MVHCLRFVFELMDDLHLLFFEGLQRQFYKDRLTESSSYAHGCHICAMGSDHSTKKTKVLVVGRDAAEQLPTLSLPSGESCWRLSPNSNI